MTVDADRAAQLYDEGNEYRRRGLWHEAMNKYSEALLADPDSPARAARDMLSDILDFRCKDYYNP